MDKEQHTPAQLRHFERYERVRQGGRFNMFDPRARQLTGLDREEYLYVLENYSSLKAAVEHKAGEAL